MALVSPCVSQSRPTFAFAFVCEVDGAAGASDSKLGAWEVASGDWVPLAKLYCARNSLGDIPLPIGSLWNLQYVGSPTGAAGGWLFWLMSVRVVAVRFLTGERTSMGSH